MIYFQVVISSCRQSATWIQRERTGGSNVMAPRTLSIDNFSMPLQPVAFIPHPGRLGMSSQYYAGGNMPQTTVSIHNLSMPLQPVAMFTSPQMGLQDAVYQQSNRYTVLHANTAVHTRTVYNSYLYMSVSEQYEPRAHIAHSLTDN